MDSQSPVIFILSILTGQAETLRIHVVHQAASCSLALTAISSNGFEALVFTDRTPFLSPNQQHQSAEGILWEGRGKWVTK